MAKTMGKDRGSGSRRGGSSAAEPEAELLEASDDELQDEELVVAEDDGSVEEADTDDTLNTPERALMAPTDAPGELRRVVEGRPRSVHIPEPIMANPVTRYVAESYVELRYNTTWPTWRTAWNFTLIVIAMSVVVGIILGAADFGLVHALTWFVTLGH